MTGPAAVMAELIGTIALAAVIVVVGWAFISGGVHLLSRAVNATVDWFIDWRLDHMSFEDRMLMSHLNTDKLEREMGLVDDDD